MGMTKRPRFRGKALSSREQFTESSVRYIDRSGHYGAAPWPFDYNRAMEQCSGWVYRCAIGNAQAAAAIPLRLFVRRRSAAELKALGWGAPCFDSRKVPYHRRKYLAGEARHGRPSNTVLNKLAEFGTDFEEVTDHPVLRVLRGVNPVFNGMDLSVFRFASQEMTGNAYLHPIMDEDLERPIELWPMMPHWTKIVPAEDDEPGFIKGYVYGSSYSQERLFNEDEVLHFAVNRGISSLFYGYGKCEAAWSALGLSVSKRISDKAFFDNMGRPDFIVSVDGDLSPEQADRIDAKLESIMRGARNVGKWLTMGKKTTVTPLQFNPKDVGEYNELLEEIAGVFGYPITKLKGNDPNRANAEQGDAGWMKDTILPMLRMDEESLNQGGFIRLFANGALEDDVVLAYDDPVPDNRQQQLEEYTRYVAGGIVMQNEVREDLGYEPAEGGDVLRVNGQSLESLDAGSSIVGPTGLPIPGFMPPRRPAVSEPDKPETPDQPESAQNVVEGEKLNGAQITAASDIVSQVAGGQMARGVAIELLIAVGLSAERAERMVAEAMAFRPRELVGDVSKNKSLGEHDAEGGHTDVGERIKLRRRHPRVAPKSARELALAARSEFAEMLRVRGINHD